VVCIMLKAQDHKVRGGAVQGIDMGTRTISVDRHRGGGQPSLF
jgi:hypothetical protein